MYIITLAVQEQGQQYDTLEYKEFLRTEDTWEVVKWITAFSAGGPDFGLEPQHLKLTAYNVGPTKQDRTFICNGPSMELADMKESWNYGLRLRLLIE